MRLLMMVAASGADGPGLVPQVLAGLLGLVAATLAIRAVARSRRR